MPKVIAIDMTLTRGRPCKCEWEHSHFKLFFFRRKKKDNYQKGIRRCAIMSPSLGKNVFSRYQNPCEGL
jgi:hypothetical protein